MIKAIIFDVDGVIFDTNKIKEKVYEEKIFREYSTHDKVKLNRLIDAAKKIENPNRYSIINFIVNKLVEINWYSENKNKLINEKLKKYEFETDLAYETASFIPGAEECIKEFSKKYFLCINTTIPQKKVKEILKLRRIDKYFRIILGITISSKKNKRDNIGIMLDKLKLTPNQIIFVGDGERDRECIEKFRGMHFIAVRNEFNDFKTEKGISYSLDDGTLYKLPEIIKKIENNLP